MWSIINVSAGGVWHHFPLFYTLGPGIWKNYITFTYMRVSVTTFQYIWILNVIFDWFRSKIFPFECKLFEFCMLILNMHMDCPLWMELTYCNQIFLSGFGDVGCQAFLTNRPNHLTPPPCFMTNQIFWRCLCDRTGGRWNWYSWTYLH